jgi:SAM-dependent methyltransferase
VATPSGTSELEAFYSVIAPHYDRDYAVLSKSWTDFYTGLAVESGGPVLEAGCGTGRICLEIARRGIEVHGADISGAMLDRFRAKLAAEPDEVRRRITISHVDFRAADLNSKFALIISPGNVINSFADRDDQRAWLRNVRRHLLPQGAFCFDTFQPDYHRMLREFSKEHTDIETTDPSTGNTITRITRCTYGLEFQRFEVDMRWVTRDPSGNTVAEVSKSILQRWFTQAELLNLLELERFRVLDYWGNWDRSPFGEGSPEQIIRAVAVSG